MATLQELNIAPGWTGTEQTIVHMRRLVSLGKRSWPIIQAASDLAKSCTGYKNTGCWAARIFGFVKSSVHYVQDPVGIELISSPVQTLARGNGDCDDMAILFNALCESIGISTRFKAVMASPSRPNEYTHVYSLAEIPGRGWVAADCSQPQSAFGWEPVGGKLPSKQWPGSEESQ